MVGTQVASQFGQQKQYQQDAIKIRTQIDVDNSNATKAITIIQGESAAIATTLLNNADAFVKNATISSQTQAYTQVASLTGQTASDTLTDYIYYTNMLTKSNSTILIGVSQA